MKLKELKNAYAQGENITQLLQTKGINSQEAIELAYDLQAGSYSEHALNHPDKVRILTDEMGELLKPHVRELDVVLDCGTGEMTSLSGITRYLPEEIELLAFDISLSRIRAGKEYAARAMGSAHAWKIRAFVAAMDRIPLPDNSIDVLITMHAIEPNHGREDVLLRELFRVSRNKVVLFEPSWEENTKEGRQRMQDLGYVRGLPEHIRRLGGKLISFTKLQNSANPLNPTCCFVIDLENSGLKKHEGSTPFICPKSGESLSRHDGYLWSEEGGYTYPIIDGVPILREQHGVLMTREP